MYDWSSNSTLNMLIYFREYNMKKVNLSLFRKRDQESFEVVKAAFNQRRKTLRNALHKFNLQESHEYAKLRAEQLSVQDFIKLTQFIEQQ